MLLLPRPDAEDRRDLGVPTGVRGHHLCSDHAAALRDDADFLESFHDRNPVFKLYEIGNAPVLRTETLYTVSAGFSPWPGVKATPLSKAINSMLAASSSKLGVALATPTSAMGVKK